VRRAVIHNDNDAMVELRPRLRCLTWTGRHAAQHHHGAFPPSIKRRDSSRPRRCDDIVTFANEPCITASSGPLKFWLISPAPFYLPFQLRLPPILGTRGTNHETPAPLKVGRAPRRPQASVPTQVNASHPSEALRPENSPSRSRSSPALKSSRASLLIELNRDDKPDKPFPSQEIRGTDHGTATSTWTSTR